MKIVHFLKEQKEKKNLQFRNGRHLLRGKEREKEIRSEMLWKWAEEKKERIFEKSFGRGSKKADQKREREREIIFLKK